MTAIEELTTKKLPHVILWLVLVFLIVAFTWAHFAIIDEVTTGDGKVIPSSKVKVIQNLEGGIIKEIFTKEGASVKKGQVLMQLSEIQFSSDYSVNDKNRVMLEIKIQRLRSQIDNKPFKPKQQYIKEIPTIVKSEQQLYQSRKNELRLLKKRLSLLRREIAITIPLVKSGAVSKVDVLRLKQALSELEGKVHAFNSASLSELNQAQDKYNELLEKAKKFRDKLARTTIRSPVNGIVKQIYVNTIGGVVKAGMPILEIVPIEDTLRIEIHVRPVDIGFIKIRQSARVKITAYDYAIYGGLEGKVEHISADTSQDKDGSYYYEVWIRTDKAYLGKDKSKLRIIPGMQASVGILTGKKSILTYLLKPILRVKEKAFRER